MACCTFYPVGTSLNFYHNCFAVLFRGQFYKVKNLFLPSKDYGIFNISYEKLHGKKSEIEEISLMEMLIAIFAEQPFQFYAIFWHMEKVPTAKIFVEP